MAALNIHRRIRGSLIVGVPALPHSRNYYYYDSPWEPCKAWLRSVRGIKQAKYIGKDPNCLSDCTYRFKVGRRHMDALVVAGVLRFGEVRVWADYLVTKRCDVNCTSACGTQCECSCEGLNHAVNCGGDGNPFSWMKLVGETTLISSEEKRTFRVITADMLASHRVPQPRPRVVYLNTSMAASGAAS